MGWSGDRKPASVRDDSPAVFIVCFVFVICCLLLSIVIFGYSLGSDAERKAAIEAGTGRWVIDAKTGRQSFRHGRE